MARPVLRRRRRGDDGPAAPVAAVVLLFRASVLCAWCNWPVSRTKSSLAGDLFMAASSIVRPWGLVRLRFRR